MKPKKPKHKAGPVELAIIAERLKNEAPPLAYQRAIELLNMYQWDYDRAIAKARRRGL